MADTTGKLHLSVDYPGETQEAPTIPAFGLEWTLPVEYSNLRFYGPGPDETYADRKHAKLGIWNTNAYDDHAPYLMPQETGNHEDVRWAEITDDAGHGMRVSRHASGRTARSEAHVPARTRRANGRRRRRFLDEPGAPAVPHSSR